MTEDLLVALASIITLGIAAVWLSWRVHLPSILVLLLVGFAAGPITGFLDPDAIFGDLLFPIVSISVAIILFEGGASLHLKELGQVRGVIRNLVTIGALVTWVVGAGAAYLLLDFELEGALLLGAILVVTGPTVIVPLLRHVRPTHAVGYTLKWEGILIDPIGAVLAVLVFEAAIAVSVEAATTAVLLGLLKTLLIGGVLSAAGAGLLVLLLDRGWVPDFLQSPLALMIVVAAFAGSNLLQPESGLLTATLMGVILANQRRVDVEHIIEFKENLRVLLISSLFILLAARLKLTELTSIGLRELGFLGVLILVARPVAVALSTIASDLNWRERTLIASIAPRGIVAAAVASIFALELAHAGYEEADLFVSITFMVIVGTVAIYGLGASPLARLLRLAQPDPQGVLIVGAHPWAREIAGELGRQGIAVRMVDSNYRNVSAARMAGIPVHYGNALTEGALDQIDLEGIGRLLAFTSNDEVNSLTAVNYSEIFGHDDVFQLPPERLETNGDEMMPRRLRGLFLFDARANYWYVTSRYDSGATFKTTNLTEAFDFQSFMNRNPDAVPLFLIDDTGKLLVFTVKNPPVPSPGQKLVALVSGQETASDSSSDESE